MENKLTKLRGGVTLVSPEERKAVESMFSEKISQWRKRKRMFKDLWDTLTENSPKDPKEFKVTFLACHSCRCYFSLLLLLLLLLLLPLNKVSAIILIDTCLLFAGGAWNRI